MRNLLTLKYWFTLRPEAFLPVYLKAFIALIILFAVLFVVFWLLGKKKKALYANIFRRLSSFFASNFFIGLVILFFSYEMVVFLSARFWIMFWGIEMLVWLIAIIRKLKEIPERKKQLEKDKEFKKYIP
ncbi:MAG: hypothetical protein PHT51_00800 [Patescibacteria group bacterium]|nr:hypothetical protein [Patescibacteria group bacterium]MDD4610599.1 hypothetical protein [Patescibacteria group bacterium]